MPIGDDRVAGVPWREYAKWRHGLEGALDGALWLHRHTWRGRAMAHLVSTDREALVRYGLSVGLHPSRLQYRPLKDPRSGVTVPAWHWDLVGPWVPTTPAVQRVAA